MRLSIICTLLAMMACDDVEVGKSNPDDGEGNDWGPCEDFNWRDETPNQIVCPYTDNCVCPSTEVCCVVLDEQEQFQFQSASCSQLSSCADYAFQCDGPEDCQTEEVCCAVLTTGGGSYCIDSMGCIGNNEVVLCRGDEHCGLGDCLPAATDSYFDDVVGYCD